MTSTSEPCPSCGGTGTPKGIVTRILVHAPLGLKPVTLVVRVRRFTCDACKTVWRQDISRLGLPDSEILPPRRLVGAVFCGGQSCVDSACSRNARCPGTPQY